MTILILKTSCSAPSSRHSFSHPPAANAIYNIPPRADGFSTASESNHHFISRSAPSCREELSDIEREITAYGKEITSLPIQCDVAFLASPRRFSDNFGFVEYTRTFHPCGVENVVIVHEEEGEREVSHFTISLTNCHAVGEDNSTVFVDAMPSTLRFPLSRDGAELKRGMERDGHYSTSSRDGTLLNGHLSFDFSDAVEDYRRDILEREKSRLSALRTEREKLFHDAVLQRSKTDFQAYNCTATTEKFQASDKMTQVTPIMLKMDRETQVKFDQETQILNQALIILSCFGLLLIMTIVWVGWKLTQKSKRRGDRQRVRVVDSVPRDIIRPPQNDPERQVTPELSPLRPSAVTRAQNTERNASQTCHETLHLVSLVRDATTPMYQVRNPESSPRHWYEEFLNPRINANEHGTDRIGTDIEGKDGTSRSLFGSGSKEHGTDALDDNEVLCASQPLAENDSSVFSSIIETTSCGEDEASEHKDHEVEVSIPTKSPFSPPPASFSLLALADHIETSSTPFTKPTATVLVSPDEIKQLSERIREPVMSPSRHASVMLTYECNVDDADSIDDIGYQPMSISQEEVQVVSSDDEPTATLLAKPFADTPSLPPEDVVPMESIAVIDEPEVDDVNFGDVDSIQSSTSYDEVKGTPNDEEPPAVTALPEKDDASANFISPSDECEAEDAHPSNGAGCKQSTVNAPQNANTTSPPFSLIDENSALVDSDFHVINDTKSLANDSMSSASLLVSVDGDNDDDSLSSASLLVSVDSDYGEENAQGETVDDKTWQNVQDVLEGTEIKKQFISDEIQCSSDDNETNDQSADEYSASDDEVPQVNDPCEITSLLEVPQIIPDENELDGEEELDPCDKAKELSAHDMKHNMIQELKESSRFRFKKTGSNGASSFAEELAAVTGNKATSAREINDDFASSLAKRVAEKELKTPAKKIERKVLTPASPTHTDNGEFLRRDGGEFLSDYW